MSSIEYLESERVKIWEQIVELQDAIKKKTSDYEYDARQASKKCSEFRNKCEQAKSDASKFLDEVRVSSEEIKRSDIGKLIAEIQAFHDELIPNKEKIDNQIDELEALFENYSVYSEKIKKLDETATTAEDTSKKIQIVFNQLISRKKEIDELYYKIFGFSETDEATGELTQVDGLKDELEIAYTNLKANFEAFTVDKNKEFSDTLTAWKTEFENIHQKIESLLPRALTTGLSYAYSKKKDDEIAESNELQKVFRRYVFGLIAISLIPFAISVYLLMKTGLSLDETLLKMPRLVLSILPLYIPVLWVAYSANRKMNLSKRLIEEYTHKEVLSKTFEGLSKQIQNIDDSEISSDLKTRLLYNILEVSSENPGKLISDYNKSDHPLMDALDKSVKLTNAIEHLAKIPGMSKLVSVLDNKSKMVLAKEAEKAASGINTVGES